MYLSQVQTFVDLVIFEFLIYSFKYCWIFESQMNAFVCDMMHKI